VVEFVEYFALLKEVPSARVARAVASAVERVGLGGQARAKLRTLSGGMLRRLEIATALLNQPAVLFLDEPTVGLDPTARRMVWERLGALREQAGTTILFTTHSMEEAERYCERLAIIDMGRLVAQGEPAELTERCGRENLEEVFAAVTGHDIDQEQGGRLSDVRAQRSVARRLG